MSEAIDFFANDDISEIKCTILPNDHSKSLTWEKEKVSPFSPKIVSDDEIIVRSWYVPIHIDSNTGELKPTAFYDALTRGLSVNRKKYSTIKKIQKAAIKQAIEVSKIRTPREYQGYSVATVSDIRSELSYDMQVFAIYDTSLDLKEGLSHADVCSLISHDSHENLTKKSVKKVIRGRLSSCFSNIISPEKEAQQYSILKMIIKFFRGYFGIITN